MILLTPMKAFVAYSSIVVKSKNSFFIRSKDSKLNGIKQVFIKRSTKSLSSMSFMKCVCIILSLIHLMAFLVASG